MNLRRDYERLYQHWLTEFQQTDLTELTQELFNDYKKSSDYIDDYKGEGMDDLKDRLLQSYKDNIKFLFNDFLKVREIKIINSALALKEINLNDVVEAEKLLYQNLVSSIKGYKNSLRVAKSQQIKQMYFEKIKKTSNTLNNSVELLKKIEETNDEKYIEEYKKLFEEMKKEYADK